MSSAPEIDKEYNWKNSGRTARVVVKTPPLPLMDRMKWGLDGSAPQTFPGLSMQCMVEVLPWRTPAFARVEDLSPVD